MAILCTVGFGVLAGNALARLPGAGPVTVRVYDERGRLRRTPHAGPGHERPVPELSGGFSLAIR